jgi:hypothetical protein
MTTLAKICLDSYYFNAARRTYRLVADETSRIKGTMGNSLLRTYSILRLNIHSGLVSWKEEISLSR